MSVDQDLHLKKGKESKTIKARHVKRHFIYMLFTVRERCLHLQ